MPKKPTKKAVEKKKPSKTQTKATAKASAKTNVVVKIDQRKTTTARKPSAPQQRNAPSTVVIQGSAPQPFYPVYQPTFQAPAQPTMTAEMVKSIAREVFPGEAHKIGIKPALTQRNLESIGYQSIYPDWESMSSISEPTFVSKKSSVSQAQSQNAQGPQGPAGTASAAGSAFASAFESKAPGYAFVQDDTFTNVSPSSKATSVASAAAAPAVVLPEEEPKKLPIIPTGNKITIKTPGERPPIKIGTEIPDDELSVYSSARQRAEEDLAQRQATEAMIISKKEAYFDGLNEEELTRYGRANGMSPIDAQKKLKKRLNDRGIKATDSDFAKREASLDILQRAEKKSGMR